MRAILAAALAMACVQAVRAQPCEGAERQIAAATRLIDLGELAEAGPILLPLRTSHPLCDDVLLALGRLRLAEGNVDDARAFLSRFIASVPLDARAYYALAELSLLNGDPVRADSASANAVALKPDYIEALVLRGRILGMKGNAGEAQKLLETACRLAPESAEAHFQLGVLFDSKNDPGEAVAQFRKVLLLNAKNPRANDYLALNLERLGKAEEAAAAYKAGLLVNSGPLFDSFLDYNYARFLMKRNCLAESKSHLDRAVSLAPETRAVYYERARVNLRLNRYEEARADAEHARSLPDPEGFVLDLQVYYLLSTIYGRLGQTDLARKYAELSRTTRVPLRWAGRM